MIFLRIGNAQKLLVLAQPHMLHGDPTVGPWFIRRWGSRTEHLVVGGTPADALVQREFGSAWIIAPLGSVGVVVTWDHPRNRADEFLIVSTLEGTSFCYHELIVTMSREEVKIKGFNQEWRFEVWRDPGDPTRINHFEPPGSAPLRIPSLDHLRVEMERQWLKGFIDGRGSGRLW